MPQLRHAVLVYTSLGRFSLRHFGARLTQGSVGAIILTGCLLWYATQTAPAATRPNVLLIITDQQHAEMMSCAGNANLQTPALDKLAREGIRFTRAYVTNPVCVPSRISMATGVMAGRMGVLNNGMQARVPELVSRQSLGQLLKGAGYATFYGGKTHMSRELNPPGAGYDEYFRDEREALPQACIDFMRRPREQPFFAVASFINPHDICFAYQAYQMHAGLRKPGPGKAKELYDQALLLPDEQLPRLPENFTIQTVEPPAVELNLSPDAITPAITMRRTYTEREWRMYRWIYCRLTEQVDQLIGQLLTALEHQGLADETLVIFTSDHGDMDACHRLASKGVFFDNSTRVGFIMRYPGRIAAGQVDSALVSSGLDLLPTVCDYVGISPPAHCRGASLRPWATGSGPGEWRKYVVTENHTGRMLRSDQYKYCVFSVGEPRESLIDLHNDAGELSNLATDQDYAAILNQHRAWLKEWIEQTDDATARQYAILPSGK